MQFNVEQFMASTVTGALDTRVIPCPAAEYPALSTKVEAASGEIKNGDNTGGTWAKLTVHWEIQSDEARSHTGRNTVVVKQPIMLDLTAEGMLDMGPGKNLRLGRLREALRQNDASTPWNPQMLVGQSGVVVVGHRPDPKDASVIYDEVTAVRGL